MLKTFCVAGVRGMGIRMASALLSGMVRPSSPKISIKTTIIHSNLRSDRDTMHASSAYSIPKLARHAQFQWRLRANLRRMLLKMGKVCEYIRNLAESFKCDEEYCSEDIGDEAAMRPRTTRSIGRPHFARKLSSHGGIDWRITSIICGGTKKRVRSCQKCV